jgi:release factor glutamine methyltransferase
MTILQVLNGWTDRLKEHQIESPRLNAELMVAHALGLTRESLYVELKREVDPKEQAMIDSLMERRIKGEPLQYILGHQEFWSIDLNVDPRVLIPRPETELLIEQALLILSHAPSSGPLRILEIGTGSGAIAISLARELRNAFIVATDISDRAVRLAKENALRAGVEGQIAFVLGDLFGPFCRTGERGGMDMILSNPPYIARSEIESLAEEVRGHEPRGALDGGEDGLDFYRKIIEQAPACLNDRGWLLLEMGQGQGTRVVEMIRRRGAFREPEVLLDFSGIERAIKAQRVVQTLIREGQGVRR